MVCGFVFRGVWIKIGRRAMNRANRRADKVRVVRVRVRVRGLEMEVYKM